MLFMLNILSRSSDVDQVEVESVVGTLGAIVSVLFFLVSVLQLLLAQQSCFLDSDDLRDLDQLFDIVRCRIGQLMVLLTSDTLRKPWTR